MFESSFVNKDSGNLRLKNINISGGKEGVVEGYTSVKGETDQWLSCTRWRQGMLLNRLYS